VDPVVSAASTTAAGWSRVGVGLADLVLGSRCAGCGRVAGVWCGVCQASLGQPCVVTVVQDVPVAAAGRYQGPVGRALVDHKERGRLSLRRPLGRLLGGAVAALPGPVPDLLVPVPSRAGAVRQRGQDHALRLASAAAAGLTRSGRPVRPAAALRVARPVLDQASLTAADRRANRAGAFAVRARWLRRLGGLRVVVIDDVVTSGASLAAAVTALQLVGARVVGCAVVAAAGVQGPTGPADSGAARLA
jgi:predicted amidophosphoribosyltransferase